MQPKVVHDTCQVNGVQKGKSSFRANVVDRDVTGRTDWLYINLMSAGVCCFLSKLGLFEIGPFSTVSSSERSTVFTASFVNGWQSSVSTYSSFQCMNNVCGHQFLISF